MKVYYAHFMGIYNTPQEDRDIKTLEALGLEVINPNKPETQSQFDIAVSKGYEYAFDEVFLRKVRDCEVFAFRALPDGRIPSGVAWELSEAKLYKKTIIELPSAITSRSMKKE